MRLNAMTRLLFILPLLALWSCIDRDLCHDHAHMVDVDINFDWSKSPDAAPSTMVVRFFTPDGRHVSRHEFTGRDGGKIRIESGKYIMLFHNGDMETVMERGNTIDTYRLFTADEELLEPMSREMPAPPRPTVAVDEPVRHAPEAVWGGRMSAFEVRPGETGAAVTLTPEEAVDHYTVDIHDVKNLRENLDVSAAITGMAGCYDLYNGGPDDEKVTLPLELHRPDDHTLTARFITFGHCPEAEGKHILSIYTSEKVYYNFDVTDQMHKAPDPHNIHIEIDGITLPTADTGMSPSVDDWEGNVEDIYIKLE